MVLCLKESGKSQLFSLQTSTSRLYACVCRDWFAVVSIIFGEILIFTSIQNFECANNSHIQTLKAIKQIEKLISMLFWSSLVHGNFAINYYFGTIPYFSHGSPMGNLYASAAPQ